MLINECLNKEPDIITESEPLIILDSKSDMFMSNNGKDTKHNRNIYIRVQFLRNGESCKMHNIE